MPDTGAEPGKQSKKALRKQRSEINSQRTAALGSLEKRIEKTEAAITAREAELSGYHQEMQVAAQEQDGPRIEGLSRSIAACQEAIDTLFAELESDMDTLDEKNARFQEKLAQIEGR